MGISNLIERVFGPRTILAQPGYDPTLESRRRTAADFGRGGLPIVKIVVYGGAAILLGISIWKMTGGAPQAAAAAGATATATLISSPTTSPTALPSTTPGRTPIPSRTPYGTPFGQKPGGASVTLTPVVNWPIVTQHALETLAYAPTSTPVVIIEYRGGGGGGAQAPLPTYTPYPTPAPLQPLPTYTPYPTPLPTQGATATDGPPTATYTPTATPTAQLLEVPPGPYRVYIPLVVQ